MIREIKQWGNLNILEQTLRDILANKGRVCIECGKSVSKPGTCDECIKEFTEEIQRDFQE